MVVRLILFGLYSLTFLFTTTAFLLIAPYVETRYFPVVGKMQIEAMESQGPDKTRVWASFTKLRNCDYIGIAWFHGRRDTGFIRVPLTLLRPPGDVSSPNRPLGTQNTGPWIVDIPEKDITENSFVELYHHCTPFWVSRTEFYP